MKFFGGPINLILISKDQANVSQPYKNVKTLYREIDVYGRKEKPRLSRSESVQWTLSDWTSYFHT